MSTKHLLKYHTGIQYEKKVVMYIHYFLGILFKCIRKNMAIICNNETDFKD